LEVEAIFIESHQVILKGNFKNTNECQMLNRFFNEVGHRFWFQGPLNHLSGERRASYIIAVFRQIL
jgi:hypothetical protein